VQFETIYASRQGEMPTTPWALAHLLLLLTGERICYDKQCDIRHNLWGFGQSDIYNKFDWLWALVVQQGLSKTQPNFQSDCSSNPHAWLCKCFESYLHEIAKGLVGIPTRDKQAIALLEEWHKCTKHLKSLEFLKLKNVLLTLFGDVNL
jgi:hypothetical protein